jgi:16S rRNA (adenine1518-N6/adenine1519-N6)-dimethyltransferase
MPDRSGHGRTSTQDLLDAAGVRPSKGLGQNFVVDPNLCERIARVAGVGPGDRVLEIGPGLGALTTALVATGADVTAVEIDPRLVEVLRETLPEGVRVVEGDGLLVDVESLFPSAAHSDAGGIVLVANLPYNVATPLVMHVLEAVPIVQRMFVMVQVEVAERFAASPGNKVYGAVSARIAYFATAAIESRIPPEVFFPQPKVTSALIAITRRDQVAVDPAEASYDEIMVLLRSGFGTRRKMLRRALAGLVTEEVFVAAGVEGTARAEELGIVEWGKLARWRRSIMNSHSQS